MTDLPQHLCIDIIVTKERERGSDKCKNQRWQNRTMRKIGNETGKEAEDVAYTEEAASDTANVNWMTKQMGFFERTNTRMTLEHNVAGTVLFSPLLFFSCYLI